MSMFQVTRTNRLGMGVFKDFLKEDDFTNDITHCLQDIPNYTGSVKYMDYKEEENK